MAVTKLSKKEWAYMVEHGLRKNQLNKIKIKNLSRQDRLWKFINTHPVLPVTLGLLACIFVVYLWGLKELINMLLSWIIGIIVVTTLVARILGDFTP